MLSSLLVHGRQNPKILDDCKWMKVFKKTFLLYRSFAFFVNRRDALIFLHAKSLQGRTSDVDDAFMLIAVTVLDAVAQVRFSNMSISF